MIRLHKYGPAFGMPDASPFVVKLETYLRIAKEPYEAVSSDVRKAPRKQLPYVEIDGKAVADSSAIVDLLENRRADKLDAHLDPKQLAVATALKSMLEEHLYFGVLYLRWATDDGWSVFEPTLKEMLGKMGVPSLMRGAIAKRARAYTTGRVASQGIGRQPRGEVIAACKKLVDAFAQILGDGPHVTGASPTTFDATAYAFGLGVLCPAFDNELRKHAATKANLVAYVDRLKGEYWKE